MANNINTILGAILDLAYSIENSFAIKGIDTKTMNEESIKASFLLIDL